MAQDPSSSDDRRLHSRIRGLHATPTAPLPFLTSVVVRSFVLERANGPTLIYNAPGIGAAKEDILALGRPDRLLINHWHEAMFDAPELDVPIFVHEKDRSKTDLPVAGTFAGAEVLEDDLRVIPTPGHTEGTTMFLWNNGEHRLLFSGDSVWVKGGEWQAVLLAESDRDAYLASLSMLMELNFDYLVPWGSEEGAPYAYPTTQEDARARLAAIAERLKSGKTA